MSVSKLFQILDKRNILYYLQLKNAIKKRFPMLHITVQTVQTPTFAKDISPLFPKNKKTLFQLHK